MKNGKTHDSPQRRERVQTVIKKENKGYIGNVDYIILLCVVLLVLVGIVMVFSSSYYTSAKNGQSMFYYLKKELIFAAVGFLAMFLASNLSYTIWKNANLLKLAYWASNLLLVMCTLFGEERGGAKRWIFGIQPSEISKAVLILVLARMVSADKNLFKSMEGYIRYFAVMALPIVLVAIENLSTAIVMGVIGMAIFFISTPNLKVFFGMSAVGIAGVLAMTFGVGFRSSRVKAWLDPFSNMEETGYQIAQSLYAIASGGMFGLGLGGSRQKLGYMPEAHNDIIFAIICEELGLFGAGIVIFLFILLIWRGILAAIKHKEDTFAMLTAAGITTMIATQVIINTAVVTNTIPNTGIPLPFISYGGTSMLIMLGCMGILLNISRHTIRKPAPKAQQQGYTAHSEWHVDITR